MPNLFHYLKIKIKGTLGCLIVLYLHNFYKKGEQHNITSLLFQSNNQFVYSYPISNTLNTHDQHTMRMNSLVKHQVSLWELIHLIPNTVIQPWYQNRSLIKYIFNFCTVFFAILIGKNQWWNLKCFICLKYVQPIILLFPNVLWVRWDLVFSGRIFSAYFLARAKVVT